MSMYYKLDENKNAIECSCEDWAQQYEDMSNSNKKHVAYDEINGYIVSTIWLGLNHDLFDAEPPLVFETMIFEGGDRRQDIYCGRYSTWQQAEEGHKLAIQWVLDGCKHDLD